MPETLMLSSLIQFLSSTHVTEEPFFNMFLLKNYHYIYSYEENEGEQYTLKGVYSVISLKVPAIEEVQEAVIFLVKEQPTEKEISLPENFQDFITVYKDDEIYHIPAKAAIPYTA